MSVPMTTLNHADISDIKPAIKHTRKQLQIKYVIYKPYW